MPLLLLLILLQHPYEQKDKKEVLRQGIKFLVLVGLSAKIICPALQPRPWHSRTLSCWPSQVGNRGELCPWHPKLEHRVPSLPLLQNPGCTKVLGVNEQRIECAGWQHSGLDGLLWTALRAWRPKVTSFPWELALWVLNGWFCKYTLESIAYSRSGDCLYRTKCNCTKFGGYFRKE